MRKEESVNSKSINFKLFWRVVGLSKPYGTLLFVTLLMALVLGPLSAIRPYLINHMVDHTILSFDKAGLVTMTWILMGLLLLESFIRFFFSYASGLLGQSIIRDLRVRVFDFINHLKLKYFDKTPVGNSTTRTINDIESINSVFSDGIINIIADVVMVIGVIVMMSISSWQLTLVCLTVLPLMVWATYIFKEKVNISYQKVRNQLSNMNSFLQERITGMRIVQMFNAEKREMDKFKNINRKYTQANLDSVLYYAVFFPVVEVISAGALALMIWYGAGGVIKETLTLGTLVAFPIYLNMLFRPIRMLADKFNTLQMGLVAAERVFKLLDKKEMIPNNGKIKDISVKGEIAFEKVSFAYEEPNFVIKDLSFTLKENETLAIVGHTGSGKTTIVNLLNRFYDVQKGEITLDGLPIQEYELHFLRAQFAMVLQDVFLFNGTIYDNIRLRSKEISKEQIEQASAVIGADLFFKNLPGGYEFLVTERGSNLSLGQRQLISFVRALVFNPKILILDEATSSIDTETEAIIQYAIEKLIERRTSIIIAHRLSTIKHADTILVMKDGEMKEMGSHEALIQKKDGFYKELYKVQFEENQVLDC
jgi:ATP-binding cassette, subfamily B, multidrug efflux pump